MTDGSARRTAVALAPGVFMLAVTVADLILESENIVLGLVVVGPVLAASFYGPRVTAAYALVAVLLAAFLGFTDEQYTDHGRVVAQLIRILGVTVGGIAAVAASHYRVERERQLLAVTRVAEAAQRAILLPVPERVGPVELAVRYDSAATESLVGGDLYGMVATPYGLRIVIGDVRGKGLSAVRLSAQVLAAFRERASDSPDLTVLLEHLHRAVERASSVTSEDFVTAALAQVEDDGRLTLAVAGHPPPLLLRDRELLTLEPPVVRPPLGLEGLSAAHKVDLVPGDRLLLYTDGLSEARRPEDLEFLPPEAIATALSHDDAFQALEALREEAVRWEGGSLADDVALVLVDYRPV